MIRIGILLAGLAALSACAPGGAARTSNLAEVCAEQAAMAQAGRTDGGPQTITCPE